MRIIAPFLFAMLTGIGFGQDLATLSGVVVDPDGAAVPDATVKLVGVRRELERSTTTDALGMYVLDSLEPGMYSLEVRKEGFGVTTQKRLRLGARDRQNLRVELRLASIATSLDVTDKVDPIASDPSFGIGVDQGYSSNLPLAGRSLDSLVLMAPGVVSGAGPGGQFNSNGMRSNTNYFTLDGVSMGGGMGMGMGGGRGGPMGGGMPMGGGPGGGGPSGSVSLDGLQEVRVQTSTFAPEFGRTPGAQIALTSRAGGNAFHGSLFEYWGNERLNANQWFANSGALPRPPMRLNQFGATLGGPIQKDRTFFFASYEGQRFRAPETIVAPVPDLRSRQQAPAALRPFLRAYPLPNGAALEDGAAQFTAAWSNPSERDTASLRLDRTIGSRHVVFVRYSLSPSNSENRGDNMVAPSVVSRRDSRSQGVNGSLISNLAPGITNDLRLIYSLSKNLSSSTMDTFGGAIPITERSVFPSNVDSSKGQFQLMVSGMSGYSLADRGHNEQKEINVVDSVTMVAGVHQYKIGADFRVVHPEIYSKAYSHSVMFRALSGEEGALASGKATTAIISSSSALIKPALLNGSIYFQDSYKANRKTTVTLGMRWDLNPAPHIRSGPKPFALCDEDLGDCGITQQLPLYDTRWADLAPRIGVASQISDRPGRETVFRGGLGVFHDLGYGSSTAAFSGAPYVSTRNLVLPTFPLVTADLLAPALPPTPPYGTISAAERKLKSPAVYQWNGTVEHSLGSAQVVSIGYAGTHGIRLMRNTTKREASTQYDILRLATNGAVSDYNAIQAQFRRRMARNFQAQVGYTWSHSIDTASNDMAMGGGFATLFTSERGDSDFDVRHMLNVSGSYGFPSPRLAGLKQALGGWWMDFVASARTGTPFDVQGISTVTGTVESSGSTTTTTRGLFAQVRPDLTGAPIWISDPTVPGGRRVNPAAFAAPEDYRQGNLGRNSLRGFPMSQIDFSLRRQVPIRERVSLSIMAQAYNVLNHPNFANPSPNEGANLASPNFGVATRTLNEGGMGGGASFFRSGGPRSIQIALRLQF